MIWKCGISTRYAVTHLALSGKWIAILLFTVTAHLLRYLPVNSIIRSSILILPMIKSVSASSNDSASSENGMTWALIIVLLGVGLLMVLTGASSTGTSVTQPGGGQCYDEEMGTHIGCMKCTVRHKMQPLDDSFVTFKCQSCTFHQVLCIKCGHGVGEKEATQKFARKARNYKSRHGKECTRQDTHVNDNTNDNVEYNAGDTASIDINSIGDEAHPPSVYKVDEGDEATPSATDTAQQVQDGMGSDEETQQKEGRMFSELAFSKSSLQYFMDDHECAKKYKERDGGIRCLIYRVLWKRPRATLCMVSYSYATVLLHMLNLIDDMSPQDKLRLVGLFTGFFSMVIHAVRDSDKIGAITLPPYPMNGGDLNAMITGKNNSLWSQIPCEEVLNVDGLHVVVSMDSLIDHLMAHGVPLSFMQDENNQRYSDGVNGCEAAGELLEKLRGIVEEDGKHDPNQTSFGYIILWSDAFLTSFVKQKDSSCWCVTATVAPPQDNARSIFHTHCIALGRKGQDHNKVILHFLDELETIHKGKWRYDGRRRKFVYTSFDIIVYMADRPERDEILATLGHAGLSSKRFRHTAYTNKKYLPSCNKCLSDLLASVLGSKESHKATPIPACNQCCNWNYVDGRAWHKSAHKIQTYPTTITDKARESIGVPAGRDIGKQGGTTYIEPKEQTFDWLKQGAELTLEEVANENWSETEGKAFLHSMAISNNQAEAIVKEGTRKRKAEELYSPNDDVIPAIWSKGYNMNIFIDCPMHCMYICPNF